MLSACLLDDTAIRAFSVASLTCVTFSQACCVEIYAYIFFIFHDKLLVPVTGSRRR